MMRKYRLPLILGLALVFLLGSALLTTNVLLHKNAPAARAAGTNHYLYTFTVGAMYVFDMDNNHQLIHQYSIPGLLDVRGAVADPASHMLYLSHGGTGGQHGAGALLKYDLMANSVVWNVNFPSGVDSPGISPDGKTLYLPDGDQNTDGVWYVVDAATGSVKTTIKAGSGSHNTIVGLDGKRVYMGGLNYNYLEVADTTTNQVIQQIGPLSAGVRPFTINGSQTLAFINTTGTIGFQVGSITTGKVLYTVAVNGFPSTGNPAAFSHGISLSPDEKELYLMDAPNSYVHVFDVSGLPNNPPRQVADIKLTPISGNQSACTYDCQKEGWVQHSRDGRFVYVADSGDVISTATRQIVANLNALANSRISIEIDWSNGVPVLATTRSGVGYVTNPAPPPPATPPGPVNKSWYFAEGRIGKGFRQYLTIGNPDPQNACSVNIQYLYTLDGSATSQSKTVTATIPAASRDTQSVNLDVGIDSSSGSAASLATTVTVGSATPNCNGVVAERPIYFTNFRGINSGTDVLGATHLGTSFYFADVPTASNVNSYLTILNPNATSATVTATYYVNGQKVQSQTTTVSPNARGTIGVNAVSLPAHVAAVVTSSQPVMVERPTYFSGVNGVSGAADVIGAAGLANDLLFAEGFANTDPNAGPVMQENLTIANLDPTNVSANVTITLKSATGATHAYTLTLASHSQVIWNVNANDTFSGATREVSAEVVSTGAGIVAQRELYFQYHHTVNGRLTQASGITDVVGLLASAVKSSYSFAEGYTNVGYNEWLTIQNPTASTETIYVTLVNGMGRSYVGTFQVGANTRFTQDITALVLAHLVQAGDDHRGYEVSMTVQTLNNGGSFVAERPLYLNTAGSAFATQGGTDIMGYLGG